MNTIFKRRDGSLGVYAEWESMLLEGERLIEQGKAMKAMAIECMLNKMHELEIDSISGKKGDYKIKAAYEQFVIDTDKLKTLFPDIYKGNLKVKHIGETMVIDRKKYKKYGDK